MWGAGFHPYGWIFPGMFFLFLFVALITRIIFFRRYGCRHHGYYGPGYGPGFGPGSEAEELLKRRLVNGEIGEEEYAKLIAILRK